MYKIIETHCHLDYLKKRELSEILTSAKEAGVEKIISIAVDPDNLDPVFKLTQDHDQVYCSQGIHPHDAKLATPESIQLIKARQNEAKVLAVGEIGLDYYYDHSPHDVQKDIFRQLLEVAIETNQPVIIHSRDADEDMIAILEEYAPRMKRKGVIHSFTSGEALAQKALELDFYLGFNGIITFKNAENVRDIVRLCPIEKILIETDAPFLTPVPHRGKENAPEYLPFILEKIAELKNLSPEEVEKQCYQNSMDLFQF